MANQATGAKKSDVGSLAIVNGYAGSGKVLRVMGQTVEVEMPYGTVTTGQNSVIVKAQPRKAD